MEETGAVCLVFAQCQARFLEQVVASKKEISAFCILMHLSMFSLSVGRAGFSQGIRQFCKIGV